MSFPKPFYRWRPHPWHGLTARVDGTDYINAYIEITPFDLVKYEVEKETGYLKIDRPQRTSSRPPALYGFVPQTYCAERVAALMPGAKRGDHDPLDICVISERPVSRGEVILEARIIGGLPMLDNEEADDKIIAILKQDLLWSEVRNLEGLPEVLVERLRHYFHTYKLVRGEESRVKIGEAYGREHAEKVLEASLADYEDHFGGA